MFSYIWTDFNRFLCFEGFLYVIRTFKNSNSIIIVIIIIILKFTVVSIRGKGNKKITLNWTVYVGFLIISLVCEYFRWKIE